MNSVRAAILAGMVGLSTPGEASEVDAASAAVPVGFAAARTGPAFTHRAPSASEFAQEIAFGSGGTQFMLAYFNWPGNPNRAEPIKILKSDSKTFTFSDATAAHVVSTVPSLVHPRIAITGDFNGDGKPDLFVGGHGYDQSPFAGEADWLLLSGSTIKRTARIAAPGAKTFTHATATADIDHDGVDDVYVGVLCCSTQGPYLLMGRKGGVPTADTKRLPAAVTGRTSVYTAAAFVDVDRDGWPDLVLGSDGAGTGTSVYYRNVGGSFAGSSPIPLPAGLFGQPGTIVVDILPMDVDGDGWDDLVLSSTKRSPFYEGFGAQVLINNRAGRFRDETASRMPNAGKEPTGAWRQKFVRADLFGDRIGDIVGHRFCPSKAGSTIAWINDGSGRFTALTRSAIMPTDTSEDCGLWLPIDVNGDGRSDLARVRSTGSESEVVDTHLNTGVPSGTATMTPVVVRAPVATTAAVGKSFTLSIAVRASRPMSFEWRREGTLIAGANGPSLTVASATKQSAGTYSVKVTTRGGTLSKTATVTLK